MIPVCRDVNLSGQLTGLLRCIGFNNFSHDVNPLSPLIRKRHLVANVRPKHSLGERVSFRNDSSIGIVLVCSDSNNGFKFQVQRVNDASATYRCPDDFNSALFLRFQ